MTTDARRLMRPGAVASMEHSVVRLLVGTAKLPDLGSPRAGQRDSYGNGCLYDGLSLLRGNSHVRLLGGRGGVTARAYPAWLQGAYRLATRWPEGSLRVASG